MNCMALAICNHLNFNVTWVGQEFFHIDRAIAERSSGFGLSNLNGIQ